MITGALYPKGSQQSSFATIFKKSQNGLSIDIKKQVRQRRGPKILLSQYD